MKCEICSKLLKPQGIGKGEEYYKLYLMKDNENICVVCGKPTLFHSLLDGYNPYCSQDCVNHSPLRIDKIKQTTEEKYDVSCVFKRKDIRQKCESY